MLQFKVVTVHVQIFLQDSSEYFLFLFRHKRGYFVNDGLGLGILGVKYFVQDRCQGRAQGGALVGGVLQVLGHRLQDWNQSVVYHSHFLLEVLITKSQFRVGRAEYVAQTGSSLGTEVVKLD